MQVGTLEAQLVADVRRFRNDMNMAKRSFDQVATSMDTGSRRSIASLAKIEGAVGGVNNAVHGLTRNVTRSMGVIGAAWVIPQMFGTAKDAIFGFNQQMDSAMLSLTTFAGANKAGALMEDLKIFGATTPFNFKDLLGTTGQMMAMGVAADELIPRLTAIGDAAAAMGGSAYTLSRVQRALGQIQMKGRAQAEELLQLAEAGIPAYKYMAEIAGGSMEEVLRMMKKGQVTAEQAIGAIVEGMSRDFGGMMEEQSKMMHGAVSNVQDFMEITVATMGRGLYEEVRDIAVGMADILGSESVQAWGTQFAENVAKSIRQVKGLVETVVQQVGPAFAETFKLAYEVVESLAGSLDAAIPVIIAFAAPLKVIAEVVKTFAVIAQPIVELVGSIDLLSDVIVQGLAAAIGFAILKKKLWIKTMYDVDGELVKGNRAIRRAAADIRETGVQARQVNRPLKNMASNMVVSNRAIRSIGIYKDQAYGLRHTMNSLSTSVKKAAVGFKSFAVANAPMLALTAAIGVGLKIWGDYRARQEENQRQVEALTVSIQEQTKALQENYDAATQVEKGALGGGDLDYKLRVQLLGDDTGKDLKKRIEEMMGGIGESFDFGQALFGNLGFDDHMDKLKSELQEVRDQAATYTNPLDIPAELLERSVAIRAEMKNIVGLQNEWNQLLENTAGVIESHTLELIGQGVITRESLELARERVQLQMVENGEAARLVSIGYGALDLGYERQILEEAIKVQLELQADAAAKLASEMDIGQSVLNSMQEGARAATTEFQRMWEAWNFDKAKGAYQAEQAMAFFDKIATGIMSDASQQLHAASKAAEEFFDSFVGMGSEFDLLREKGYAFQKMLVEQVTVYRNLGLSSQETATMLTNLAAEFVASAQDAGYARNEIRMLLQQMGLLEQFPDIELYIDLNAEEVARKLQEVIWAMADLASIGGAAIDSEMQAAMSRLQQRFAALTTSTRRSARNAQLHSEMFNEAAASSNAAASASGQQWEEALRYVDQWVSEMQSLAQYVSSGELAAALTGTPEQIGAAWQRMVENIRNMSVHTQAALEPVIESVSIMVGELQELAREHARIVNSINTTQSALADWEGRLRQIQDMRGTVSLDPWDQLMSKIFEAGDALNDYYNEYDRLQQRLEALYDNAAANAQSVQSSLTLSLVTGTNTEAAGWLQYLEKFASNIEQLRSEGFPAMMIQEVMGLGLREGYFASQRLLQMGDSQRSQAFSLHERIQSVASEIGGVAAELQVQHRADDIRAQIDELAEVIEREEAAYEDLLGQAERMAQENVDRLAGQLSGLEAALAANVEAQEALRQKISEELMAALGDLSQHFGLFPEELREALENAVSRLDTSLGERVAELNAGFSASAQNLSSAMGSAASSISSAVSQAASTIASASRAMASQSSQRTYRDYYHPITSGDAEKITKVPRTWPRAVLAGGGIVDRPTEALVGEAGPEAVIPLDKLNNMFGADMDLADEFERAIESGWVPTARDLLRVNEEIQRVTDSLPANFDASIVDQTQFMNSAFGRLITAVESNGDRVREALVEERSYFESAAYAAAIFKGNASWKEGTVTKSTTQGTGIGGGGLHDATPIDLILDKWDFNKNQHVYNSRGEGLSQVNLEAMLRLQQMYGGQSSTYKDKSGNVVTDYFKRMGIGDVLTKVSEEQWKGDESKSYEERSYDLMKLMNDSGYEGSDRWNAMFEKYSEMFGMSVSDQERALDENNRATENLAGAITNDFPKSVEELSDLPNKIGASISSSFSSFRGTGSATTRHATGSGVGGNYGATKGGFKKDEFWGQYGDPRYDMKRLTGKLEAGRHKADQKFKTGEFAGKTLQEALDFTEARIPKLATGGIVTRPTLAMIAESGPEAVVPLGSKPIGEVTQTFNITVNAPSVDPEKVVEAIRRYSDSRGNTGQVNF